MDVNLVENGNGKCFAGIDNQALYSKTERQTEKANEKEKESSSDDRNT